MYKIENFDSGLRFISHSVDKRNSASIGIWIGVGGRYEADGVKGAAHFLEHIVFKGSKNYSCEAIKSKIEGVGGALNAFTSEEQTCFYAKVPSRHAERCLEVLSDMLLYPAIAPADVKKEKTVILEEIKMYKDLPQYYVTEILDELLWPGHPLGKSLIGTEASVSGISYKDLRNFHAHYYNAGRVVVSACGKINHDRLKKQISRKFKNLKNGISNTYIPVSQVQTAPRFKVFKKNTEQMHLALGMPAYDENDDNRYALTLLNIILGGNMSSRLFVEIREKRGLAYSVSSSAKYLHDTGVFLIRAGVDNNKIVDTVELMIKELKKIVRTPVSQGEFTRAKDYLLGQLLLGLEDTMDHMLWIGESLVAKNRVRTLNDVIKKIELLTKADLLRVAKDVFNPKKFNLALVGPITSQQERRLRTLLSG